MLACGRMGIKVVVGVLDTIAIYSPKSERGRNSSCSTTSNRISFLPEYANRLSACPGIMDRGLYWPERAMSCLMRSTTPCGSYGFASSGPASHKVAAMSAERSTLEVRITRTPG